MRRVVVVGGGIAGLTLAWLLRSRTRGQAVEVLVLERRPAPGGHICSERIDGYLCEAGPNGFLDSAPHTLALVEQLRLGAALLPSDEAARRRFVYRRGTLHQIPGSFWELLATDLLSWPGKLRVLAEPFIPPARPRGDESIEEFAVRRIGREATAALVDPMVAGVFGGDPRALSLPACFPRLRELEQRYGGLGRALVALQARRAFGAAAARLRHGLVEDVPPAPVLTAPRPSPHRDATRAGTPSRRGDALGAPAGRLTSFVHGMEQLVRALCEGLGEGVRLQHRVVTLDAVPARPDATPPLAREYLVDVDGHGWIEADAVVLAGPAAESARIVTRLDPHLAALLGGIPTAPMVVVSLGYDEAAVRAARGPLDGFGLLVPRDEPPRLLGVLWESCIFPGRAPHGKLLLRAMLGGARDPHVIDLTDDEILRIVRRDLARTMRLALEPEFVHLVRHRLGIPQYTLGHLDRLAAIEAQLARHPGLFLGGSAYRGVGLNHTISDAYRLADRILTYLDLQAPASEPGRS